VSPSESTQRRKVELRARNVQEFCLNDNIHVTFKDPLHAARLRHGTDGFTSNPKEGVLRIFFCPKNPTAMAGFEPANLGTKGQHATSRPPKPLWIPVGQTSNTQMTNTSMTNHINSKQKFTAVAESFSIFSASGNNITRLP
jgi:hypothetical protein